MYGLKHEYVPAMGGWMPLHNKDMESSAPGIYVAGDTAGVEEANTALDEGRLAGIAMAQELGHITEQNGEVLKEEIRQRLTALRMGPFGEKRLQAKEKYMQMGCAV
jgi:pyruvate/2-oxoglutarate dehydrogenase complex dihydrolipoamide dehydrogenase (E3) component